MAAQDAVARAEGTDIIVDHAAASSVLAGVAALAGDDATSSAASVIAAELNDRKAATTTTANPVAGPGTPSSDARTAPPEVPAEAPADAADGPWNEADRLARRFVEFYTAGERQRWLPLVAPDQVTRDLRPLVGVDTAGVDGVADAYPRDETTREMASSVETLATRGDRLALIRWRARSGRGREWDSIHLNRWTPAGQNDLNIIYPSDQVGAAIDELDRLYLDEVSPSSPEAMLVRIMGVAYGALRNGDLDGAMSTLSDRYVQRDYRSLAWPTVDWPGMRERLATMIGADADPWLARIHRIDGLVALWQAEVRVNGEHGYEQTDRHLLLSVTDPVTGLIESIDQFSLDAFDDALRRFDELTGDQAAAEHEPWNEADRLAREGITHFFSSNSEDRYRYLHPDHVSEDRRPVVGHRTEGRDDIANLWVGTATDGTELRLETIAVRGENLVLYRVGVASPRAEFDFLHLDRWTDDGLHDLLVRFDLGQLPEAIDELNRLYLEELGDTTAGLNFRVLLEGVDLLPGGDVEGFLALHAPEIVMRDHRSIGWGELRLDEYAERLRSIADVPGEVRLYQERFHALEEGTLSTCLSQNLLFRFADGSEQSSRSVMVMVMDPLTGLIVSMDQFAEDDVDTAMECYQRLLAERGPTLHNDATVRANLVNFWLRRGDDDSVRRVLAHDGVVLDADGESLELEPVERREVMAVRGERLALVQVSGPGHAFVIEEIDDRGRLVSVTRFLPERVNDAVTALDERWLELEADGLPDVERLAIEYSLALNRADTDRLATLLHDDHEVIDHRPLGWGQVDRDQVIGDVGAQGEETGAHANVASERLAASSAGTLSAVAAWTVAPDGSSVQGMIAYVVVHVADGQIRRTEMFEHLSEARARFDALDGDVGSNPAETTAVRALRESTAALNDHSFVARRRELTAPGYTHTDHRPIIGHGPKDADELIPLFATAGQASLTFEPLELRGDRFALSQGVTTYENGEESAYLGVTEVDGEGRVAATVFYEVDELDRARVELNRRWTGSLSERRQEVSRLGFALGEAWVAPSGHSLDELLAPGFLLVDSRTLGMGTLDREGFEQALCGREADGTTGPPVPSRVEFVSDDVMVFRANNLGHVPGSGIDWEEIACNVLVAEGGRIARIEMFDEQAWDAAIARSRELVRDRSSDGIALDNWVTRWTDRHVDESGRFSVVPEDFAESYERIDRRSGTAAPAADRDQILESVRVMGEMGGRYTWWPVAIRGDRFGLVRIDIHYDESVVEFLTIDTMANDSQLGAMLHFDPDQLTEALAELDELWIATLDPVDAETRRIVLDFVRAYEAFDVEGLRSVLTPDFEWVDHLPARRFPPQDLETFLTATVQRRDVMGDGIVVTRQIHSIEHGVMVASSTILPADQDAAAWSEEIIAVLVTRKGRLSRIESFAPDDLDGALARAAELAAPVAVEVNTAGRVLFELCLRWNAREHVTDLLADDFVRVDRRAVVAMPDAGRDDMVNVAEGMWAAGARWPDEPTPAIAERGDRIALHHGYVTLDDGASAISYLTVMQVDADGLATRLVLLDDPEQLDEAFVEIDRLAAEEQAANGSRDEAVLALSHPLEAHADRFAANFFTDGFDAIRDETFEPDFVREDRRSLIGFPASNLDEFRDAAHQVRVEGALPEIRRGPLIAVRDNAYVGTATTVYPGGQENDSLVVLVAGPTDRIGRMVVFDPDDREAAILEMNRAWAGSLPDDCHAILRLSGELARVTRSVDLDGIVELMSDDVVMIDHRSIGAGELDLESFRQYHGHRAQEGRVTGEAPETYLFGPHVILFQSLETTTSRTGASWEEIFYHVLVSRDGKIERWEWFDADQRAAAFTRAQDLGSSQV